MINSSIHKTLIDSILRDPPVFDGIFRDTGISHKDINGKTNIEITEICEKTFKSPIEDLDELHFESLNDDETQAILNSVEEIENHSSQRGGNPDTFSLLGNISSCHIHTIPSNEKEKMSLYMTYIENIIDSMNTRSGTSIKSVRIPINIGGKIYYIVFCYRKEGDRKSIISFYTDISLKDELIHLSFFLDSFIHLTFIKGTPPSPIKSSYRLYYNSNPDNKNGLRDILTILAEILSQIFDTTEEINTKFWCDKPNNNWYSLLDKNHLPNSIKVEFKKNLLSLMSAILFLSCKKKMAPPDEKKMAPPDEKKNKSKSKSRSISRR